jgi:uncharacterized protein (TIGR03790 family)
MRLPAKALFICVLTLCGVAPGWAALEPSQLFILVNKDTPVSAQVARMYVKLRAIPASNVLSLSLGTDRQITPAQYWSKAAPPIKKYLEANPEIRCIVTTSGVPYTIQATDGKDEGAAFDSELAAILREAPGDQKRRQPNPLYLYGMNRNGITDPRKLQMVFVARLDGPDLKTMTRMVEDAVAVEKTGFEGPVFGDAQGIDGITGYGVGDATIRAAIDRLSGAGFASKLDMKQESWKKPQGSVGDQAAGASFYVGWYDLLNFQDIFGAQGLARGSIAWHIASGEAQDLWDPKGSGWAINLMRRGVAVTFGPVREPYLEAFPHGDIFVEALLSGATVAESYWLSLPNVSWAMVILGDPLYRPFALKPRPSLVARAYISEDSNHILEKGETSSLLVLLECVGPAGSGTPAMTATAEAEMGLAGASGSIAIPALEAGQNVIVRVPKVTAGDDPTGMFRLRLNVQEDGAKPRRIVLEGRIGFSRLTSGLLPKSQMFVSPSGDALISGQFGNSSMIDTGTLRSQTITPPSGYGVAGAAFSTDGFRIAIALLDSQQKKSGMIITDAKLGQVQSVPAGTRFMRWLQRDQVLLARDGRLIRHPFAGGEDHIFDTPPEWPDGAVAGSVISGTDLQYLTSPDGKLGVQEGSRPFREVLSGTRATGFSAVADDLSLFGGVDSRKRLWIQHGLDGDPIISATGVQQVLWGPISHRALVQDENNRSRVYDGRDDSWVDLGSISAAQWSPDEERLVFVEPGEGYLSILIGRRIERLSPMARIGRVAGIAIPNGGDKAFLLAGIGGGLDVWMVALPPQAK